MIKRICPNPECKRAVMPGEKCVRCGSNTEITSSIFWCRDCNIPIFEKFCFTCGKEASYIATDIRPVFPEESLLLAIVLGHCPEYFQNSSIWYGSNSYIVDGKKIKISVTSLNKLSNLEIEKIRKIFDANKKVLNYDSFNLIANRFIETNKGRYNYITEEATHYVQKFLKKYSIDDMLVSFSGGKDSTVTSHIVNRALGTNKVLHIYGDTTLEFPYTLEYKKSFNKNEESFGVRILTAKNREKNFEDLVEVVGPPSRVLRWCCTVFKTGAIQKTISSAFKDKTNILTFQGIRRCESASRSKYERESDNSKISKQTVASPIIDWLDFDVWLYILSTRISFNYAYKLGYTRVGCWCCPNNSPWSEFLSKVHLYEQYTHWRNILLNFAKRVGKPDAENYVDDGKWKARQGGNGLIAAQKTVVAFQPCATDENAFNYDLQKPISEELYELFKPFGYINKELGNKRLGEVYVMNKAGKVVLVLKGRLGSNRLKISINNVNIAGAKNLTAAEGKIQCQLMKYQMCLACKACEGVCKHDAIWVKDNGDNSIIYTIDNEKCVRCGECVGHFDSGCYMKKVLRVKKEQNNGKQ